ncbi:MAG: fibronectin type III domain-containing protein [Verrucomicrobia bacterium]|nr:fibronectin type III domain-containing protein [Verrucomicrobiota bacterium]
MEIAWESNSMIKTGFRIERKVSEGPYITLVNVGGNIGSFSDVTVSSQTTYTYRILAISFEEFSEYSNEASVTTPALVPSQAPSKLVIDSQGLDNVILSWKDTSSDEIGFRIQRAIGDGAFETLNELAHNTTQYGDFEVDELSEYSYRVVSFNDAGESIPSNEVSTQIEFRQPNNLLALAISSSQINLSWNDNSAVETGYEIERKAGDGNFELLIQLNADVTAFSDTTVTPLSTYTYRIIGVSGINRSNPSNEFSTTTPNIPEPGAASDLVVNLVDSSFIALSWTDNSLIENGFYVERMVGSGSWVELIQLPANSTSVQDLQVGELETFAYRVIAFNDGGDSAPSNEAAILFPFIAPSNLTASATDEARIDLTWSDNSLVETGYQIERKSDGGAYEVLTTTGPGASTFVDETTLVNVTYTYRVLGLFEGGESTPSNEDSATTTPDTITLETPTGLTANAIAYNQIHLTWVDNSDNESGFRFERKIGESGDFTFIGNSPANSTSFTDVNLSPDTGYIYRMTAFIAGAQVSDTSNEASATTPSVPVPEVPLNLAIVAQNYRKVSLSWEDASGIETGFRVQRKTGTGIYEELATVSENANFFNDSTVVEFKEYSYRISAYNSSGYSENSNEIKVTVPFASPRLLAGEAINSYKVNLEWDDTSLVETGYRLERKPADGNYAVIGILGPNTTQYLDDSVVPDRTYSYRVFAVKNGSDSLPSILVNITTPNIPAPRAPTGLRLTVLSDTSISINWTDNSDNEAGFRIYRKEVSAEVWAEIGDVIADVNLFVDDDVVAGVNYSYRVSAYNSGGSVSPIESGVIIPVPGRLINISTRGLVETGDNVMIGSFVIQGDGPKTVYIRGIGPSIASSVNAPILEDPEITLVSGADLNRPIAYNDDWRDINEKTIVDLGLPPKADREAAIVIKLQPGSYSAILSGVDFTAGFGLIEIYEVDFSKNIRMVNISTRSFVQEGDKRMIGGFVVRGDTPTRVYIKASGPSLHSSIENRLADPVIELFSGQERMEINDNWEQSPRIAEIFATGIAPSNSKEAAIVATLEPGPYTAIVGGANNSSGYSLLEIYYYPE